MLAWKAARRLGIKGQAAFVIALLTGLYPPILLYSKYTWAETNLMVLPWAVLLLLLRLYGEGEGRRMRDSVLLAAAAVYAYMSHQRGMVLILAVVLTLICLEAVRGKVILPAALRRAAQRGPCGGKRKGVCWTAFLLTLAAGWLFHSGASTFGCAFLGLFFLFGVVWKRLRGQKKQGQEKQRQEKRGQGTWEEGQGEPEYLAVSLLGLFCYFGAMALGLLFFFQDLYGYFDGSRVERCDHLLFGRYLESSVPLLLFAGLIVLWGKRRDSRRLYGAAVLLYLCAALATGLRLLPRMDQVNCYVHSLMALNLFMDTEEVTGTLAVIPNYPEALAAFGLLSFLVFVLLLCMRGRRGRRAGAAVLCVLFLWIYVWNSVTVTGRVDRFGATKYAEVYRTSEAEVYRTSEDA